MRSTISSQSELCLSRLVFPLRVIVFMFIRVYLGCARCLRAMTRKAARKPRSSHPCFAHFFWFQDAVFCVMNRPSLPLYDFLVGWTLILFYYTYYVGVFYFILVMTHRWNHVRFFPFFFSITFTSPSKSNLPTHLSRTRGLGWLRLWRGLLHREFVQLARNTEPALIWSHSLCSTSFCNLSFFVPQGRCQFSFLFICYLFSFFFLNLTSVQSSQLSALNTLCI
jgi:hypothetical protein